MAAPTIAYVVFERHLVNPENTSWRIMTTLPNQPPWREVQEMGERKEEEEVTTNLTPAPQQEMLTV
jgi:hypothetical protein